MRVSFLNESKVSKITLIEDNHVISQDKGIAKIFNEYFRSIPVLNMPTEDHYWKKEEYREQRH